MTPLVRSRLGETCLSDRQIDEILSGDATPDAVAGARLHMAECARCRDRRVDIERDRLEFLKRHPAPTVKVPRGDRRHAFLGAGAAFLAAAAVSVLWVRGSGEPTDSSRTKGGSSLGFYVKHGDAVFRGTDGQLVHAGDSLRFVVRSKKSHLGILSVDGARNVSVYFPPGGHTANVNAQQEIALPESTLLDRVVGTETLYGVFCDAPTELKSIVERLRVHPDAALEVPGCDVDVVKIRKEP